MGILKLSTFMYQNREIQKSRSQIYISPNLSTNTTLIEEGYYSIYLIK